MPVWVLGYCRPGRVLDAEAIAIKFVRMDGAGRDHAWAVGFACFLLQVGAAKGGDGALERGGVGRGPAFAV